MVIIIFYQTTYIWDVLGYALPAMPAVKLSLGCWIMLPQLKGEFFLYHMMLDYILQAERKLLDYRCQASSGFIGFLMALQLSSLQFFSQYISEECIVKT